MSQMEIFISYAGGGESEDIVNQLDKTFQDKGITIVRDKRDLGFKGRIKEFMEQIGRGKAVIVVISEKYLKSENCMFELVQIAKNGQFYDRIFPIVLADAQIYKPVQRIKYIQHWEQQIKEFDEAMKTVSAANLQGFREEIDQYTEIRNTIAELTNIIKDMNVLTPEMHSESGFEELIDTIERKMPEASDVSTQNPAVQEFTNTDIETQRRLRLTVHRAFFLPNGPECYFINATNLSDREVEITHIWFDCKPQVHAFQPDRPLPKRLKPDETWETWIEVHKLPDWVHKNPYDLARARLSTGVVIESQENKNVPEEGYVPGGPITKIWKVQKNRIGQISDLREEPAKLEKPITYRSRIRLVHVETRHHLHSHSIAYNHSQTSGQQQVTAFAGSDANDYWIVKESDGKSESEKRGRPVENGDVIRLEHEVTRKNLHSHRDYPSPVTGQQEVTAFGVNGVGDFNDNWRLEVDGGGTWYTQRRIRLVHVETQCTLHSHSSQSHPDYTMGQQEVTCFAGRDVNDWWYAELCD